MKKVTQIENNYSTKKEDCVDKCTQRSLNSHTRLSRAFADIQVKKMEDAIKAQEQQMQQERQEDFTNVTKQ